MFKYLKNKTKKYIFTIISLTVIIFLSVPKSFAENNIFVVDNIEVKGVLDLNFTRDKYINNAFKQSFKILLSRTLTSTDIAKIKNTKIKKIKSLINSFQILNETYKNNEYKAKFKISYNDTKVKKFLFEKSVSFSQHKKISAVFFPILFVNDSLKDFSENYFFKNWLTTKIPNESIEFILPLEDLDDISQIKKFKNNIENLNIESLVNKYNTKNYAFVLIEFNKQKLNMYIKTNFEDSKVSKNTSYKLNSLNDEVKLNSILVDLKTKISDVWKEANILNLLIPLSIKIKFEHKELKDLDKLKSVFNQISIIDKYTLEEFNVNNSFFKIYYFGNPKKLRLALLNFNYNLKNDQGYWEIYK